MEPLAAEHFQRWIDVFLLERNDPRPSHDALAVMAKDLIHVAERPGGADSPVLEERARRLMAMVTSAEQYRADVAQYLEFDPGAGLTKAFTKFARADRELAEAGIPPAPHPAPSPATKLGHPQIALALTRTSVRGTVHPRDEGGRLCRTAGQGRR